MLNKSIVERLWRDLFLEYQLGLDWHVSEIDPDEPSNRFICKIRIPGIRGVKDFFVEDGTEQEVRERIRSHIIRRMEDRPISN